MHVQEQQISLVKAIDAVKDYAIFMLSPEGIVLSWNKGAERLKGYTEAEIVGQSFTCFYLPKIVRQGHPAKLLQLAQAQGSYEEEGWRLRKDGSRFWANIVITSVYDESKKLIGYTKITRDLTERVSAQKSLAQLNVTLERLKQIAKSAHIGLWEWDILTDKIYPDANIHTYFDIDPVTFNYTLKDFITIIYEADRRQVQQALQRCIETGTLYNVEYRIVKRDGTLRYLAGRGEVLRNELGHAIRMLGICWDITEHRQLEEQQLRAQMAEQSLLAISDHLNLALQAANAGTWTWLVNENIVTWDEANYAVFGRKAEDFGGTYEVFLSYLHPADRERVNQDMRSCFEKAIPYDTQFRVIWPDGTLRYVAGRGGVVEYDEAGNSVRMMGINWDITEQQELELERLRAQAAEQSLYAVSAHLQLALQAAKAGTWTWLIKENIIIWDETNYVLFNLQPGQFDGSVTTFLQLLHPDDRQQVQQAVDYALKHDQILDMEFRAIWPDGSQHWLAGRGRLILDQYQQPDRLIGISWSIDERKKMEQWRQAHQAELAQVSKISSMHEVASRLAHELNQPLMAITIYTQGCLELLESEPERYEPLRHPLKTAARQAVRAGEIIHRMKDFVRSVNAFREIAELNTLIHESRALIIYEKSGYKVDICCDLARGLPALLLDKVQIQQVIINLLSNSIEAMQDNQTEQPTIWICSQIVNRKVKVSISDNGPGIDPAAIDKLFSAYYTTKPYGMGLGLAICQSIIEAHGGSIACIPTKQGAHLEFTLPIR